MAFEETTSATDNGTASPQAAPAGTGIGSQPAASDHDDLGALIEQFERGTAQRSEQPAPKAPGVEEPQATDRPVPKTYRELAEELERLQGDANASNVEKAEAWELRNQAEAVAGQIQAAELLKRNTADFDRIVERGNALLADFPHLPKEHARRWLIAESLMNQKLRDAFDRAYESPQAMRRANSIVKRTLDRMRKEAAAQPDPIATEDVAAVTHAVRGASGRVPESRPPDFSQMSDNEFARERKKLYGF